MARRRALFLPDDVEPRPRAALRIHVLHDERAPGTHADAPSHVSRARRTIGDMPLSVPTWTGPGRSSSGMGRARPGALSRVEELRCRASCFAPRPGVPLAARRPAAGREGSHPRRDRRATPSTRPTPRICRSTGRCSSPRRRLARTPRPRGRRRGGVPAGGAAPAASTTSTPRRCGRSSSVSEAERLGEQASDPVGFLDASHGQDERAGAEVGVVPPRGVVDVLVGPPDRAVEVIADDVGLPEERVEVLDPLEVRDRDAAGVGEDVRNDDGALAPRGCRRRPASSGRSLLPR